MTPIDCSAYRRAVVLTGAGISVASGLRPYRGPGGIWNDADLERLSHVDTLHATPDAVWRAFGPMRTEILQAAQSRAPGAGAVGGRAAPGPEPAGGHTEHRRRAPPGRQPRAGRGPRQHAAHSLRP